MMRSVGTLTRADLAETINRKMGFSRAESLDMVEAVLDKMIGALEKGENVKISGFGGKTQRRCAPLAKSAKRWASKRMFCAIGNSSFRCSARSNAAAAGAITGPVMSPWLKRSTRW